MATSEPKPCVWAADLVARLEETGTPPAKLLCVRDAMAARWDGTAELDDSDPGRHLSAAEAAGILSQTFGATHGTVAKALLLIERGEIPPPRKESHPAQLIPPPPRDKAPAEAVGTPAEFVVSAEAKPGTPGVVDVAAAVPTIGPKAVETDKKPAVPKANKPAVPKANKPAVPKAKKPAGAKPGATAGAKELIPASTAVTEEQAAAGGEGDKGDKPKE